MPSFRAPDASRRRPAIVGVLFAFLVAAALLFGADAEAAPPAAFEWSMPDRFGLDADGDHVIDEIDDETPQSIVHPSSWRVDLDACQPDGSALPGATYSWSFAGAAPTTPSTSCTTHHDFPALDTPYEVALTVSDSGGTSTKTETIVLQDHVIVALGDSAASGEGNPDWLEPNLDFDGLAGTAFQHRWNDEQCHRSALAGPAQAALRLEQRDPHSSVTFVHLACSGARITRGVLGPYQGIVNTADPRLDCDDTASPFYIAYPDPKLDAPRPGDEDCLKPQLEQLEDIVGTTRDIDAITVSAGINDVFFSKVVMACLLTDDCSTMPSDEMRSPTGQPQTAEQFLGSRFGQLPDRYAALVDALMGLNLSDEARVFFTGYPDPSTNDDGATCRSSELDKLIGASPWLVDEVHELLAAAGQSPNVGVFDTHEWAWGRDAVGGRLTTEIQHAVDTANAEYPGRFAVSAPAADAFEGHGYCANDTWMRDIPGSLLYQRDPEGSFHPNRAGHFYGYALPIEADLATQLGITAPALPPRVPGHIEALEAIDQDLAPLLDVLSRIDIAEELERLLPDDTRRRRDEDGDRDLDLARLPQLIRDGIGALRDKVVEHGIPAALSELDTFLDDVDGANGRGDDGHIGPFTLDVEGTITPDGVSETYELRLDLTLTGPLTEMRLDTGGLRLDGPDVTAEAQLDLRFIIEPGRSHDRMYLRPQDDNGLRVTLAAEQTVPPGEPQDALLGVVGVAVHGPADGPAVDFESSILVEPKDPDGDGEITLDELVGRSFDGTFDVECIDGSHLRLDLHLRAGLPGLTGEVASLALDDTDLCDGLTAPDVTFSAPELADIENLNPADVVDAVIAIANALETLQSRGDLQLPFGQGGLDDVVDIATQVKAFLVAGGWTTEENPTTATPLDETEQRTLGLDDLVADLEGHLGLPAGALGLRYEPAAHRFAFDLDLTASVDGATLPLDASLLERAGILEATTDAGLAIDADAAMHLGIALDVSPDPEGTPTADLRNVTDRLLVRTGDAIATLDASASVELETDARIGPVPLRITLGDGTPQQLLAKPDPARPLLAVGLDGPGEYVSLADLLSQDPARADVTIDANAGLHPQTIHATASLGGEPLASGAVDITWQDLSALTGPTGPQVRADGEFQRSLLRFADAANDPLRLVGLVLAGVRDTADDIVATARDNEELARSLPVIGAGYDDVVTTFETVSGAADTLLTAHRNLTLPDLEEALEAALVSALGMTPAQAAAAVELELDTTSPRTALLVHLDLCAASAAQPGCADGPDVGGRFNVAVDGLGIVGVDGEAELALDYLARVRLDLALELPAVNVADADTPVPSIPDGEPPVQLLVLGSTGVTLDLEADVSLNEAGDGAFRVHVGPYVGSLGIRGTGEDGAAVDDPATVAARVRFAVGAGGDPAARLTPGAWLDAVAANLAANGPIDTSAPNVGCGGEATLDACVRIPLYLRTTAGEEGLAAETAEPSSTTTSTSTSTTTTTTNEADTSSTTTSTATTEPSTTTTTSAPEAEEATGESAAAAAEVGAIVTTADGSTWVRAGDAPIAFDAPDLLDPATWTATVPPSVRADLADRLLSISSLVEGIRYLLAEAEASLDGAATGQSIPVLGDALDAGADIAAKLEDAAARLQALVATVEAHTSAGTIRDAIEQFLVEQLGAGGAELLLGDVDVVMACGTETCSDAASIVDVTGVNVRFAIGQTGQVTAPTVEDGLAGFDLDTESPASASASWRLDVAVGVDEDGFYIDPVNAEGRPAELTLSADANLPGSFDGTLAGLPVRITDLDPDEDDLSLQLGVDLLGTEPIGLVELVQRGADVLDRSSIAITAQGCADVDMSFEIRLPTGGDEPAAMPGLTGEIDLGADWNGCPGSTGAPVDLRDGLAPVGHLALRDVSLDLGRTASDLVGPVLENLQDITMPVQPVVERVTSPIPIVSDVARLAGKTQITWLDAFEAQQAVAGNDVTGLVTTVELIDFINRFDADSQPTLALPILEDDLVVDMAAAVRPVGDPETALNQLVPAIPGVRDLVSDMEAAGWTVTTETQAVAEEGSGAEFRFPVYEDPMLLLQLLFGKDVDLAVFDAGPLSADASFDFSFGLPFAQLGIRGGAEVTGHLAVSYDTAGLRRLVAARPFELSDLGALIHGLGIDDLDEKGEDVPEIRLEAGVEAYAYAGVPGLNATASGGVRGHAQANLRDPDGDGKLRYEELADSIRNPLCLFDLDGKIEAYLQVTGRFGPFTGTRQIVPPYVLLEFRNTDTGSCGVIGGGEPGEDPLDGVARVADFNGATLDVNVGDRADLRNEPEDDDTPDRDDSPTDGAEDVAIVDHGNGLVTVTVDGASRTYGSSQRPVTSVNAFTGLGDDQVEVISYAGTRHPFVRTEGGAGNDTILGGDHTRDMVVGGPGNDVIDTRGGNDFPILGNEGDDHIKGGDGTDEIQGNDGADLIEGGGGNDVIHTGNGADVAYGEAGDDRLFQSVGTGNDSGPDVLDGGEGSDTLTGSPQGDLLIGGIGGLATPSSAGDTLSGGEGNDCLVGDVGVAADLAELTGPVCTGQLRIEGPGDNDSLTGNGGNDVAFGQGGRDNLYGSDGDDLLDAGPGDAVNAQTLDGQNGHDVLVGGPDKDDLDGGGGDDVLDAGDGADSLFGGFGDDRLDAGPGADTFVDGGRDEDAIDGGPGNDLLRGDTSGYDVGEDDRIFGGDGNDEIYGEAGADVVYGDAGDDKLRSDSSATAGDVDDGDDEVHGGSGLDDILTGFGDDTVFGDAGNDVLHLGGGNDVADGGDGNDRVHGREGDDDLAGGAGHDVLVGDVGTISERTPSTFPSGAQRVKVTNDLTIGGADTFDSGSGDDFVFDVVLDPTSAATNGGVSLLVTDQPDHATPSGTTATAWPYESAGDYEGSDEMRYQLRTSTGSVVHTGRYVVLNDQNRPPTPADDRFVTEQSDPVSGSVLGNDTDPDGDALTVAAASGPTEHGTYTIDAAGRFTYTPDVAFAGEDGFDYTVDDGFGGTATAHVTIEVRPDVAPPGVDCTDAPTGWSAAEVRIDCVAVDAGTGLADPAQAAFSLTTAMGFDREGIVALDPPAVCDVAGNCTDLPAVDVRIDRKAPTITSANDGAVYPPGATIVADVECADGGSGLVDPSCPPDGDVLDNAPGEHSFTVTAEDHVGHVNAETFTYTVENADPTPADDSFTTDQAEPLSGSVLGNDTDAEGDALTVVATNGSTAHGTYSIEADGTFTYVPELAFAGTDGFDYTVEDAAGGTGTARVTITVVADTEPPVVDCTDAPAGWSGAEVTIDCTADDAGTGLADPSQLGLSLSTAIGAGNEGEYPLDPPAVCDRAGNCTDLPAFAVQVDRRAPAVSSANDGVVYPAGTTSIVAEVTCADGGSGLADPTCPPNGQPLDATPGEHSFTVTAIDAVGNTTTESFDYTVLESDDPIVSIGDSRVVEGRDGTRRLLFPVTLSEAGDQTVGVVVRFAGGTATAGQDYVLPRFGTATVAFRVDPATGRTPTVQYVAVDVLPDTRDESDETVVLELEDPIGVVVGRSTGTGVVFDDDPSGALPGVSVGDVTIVEGDDGTRMARVPVSLSSQLGSVAPLRLRIIATPGSATVGSDYRAVAQTVTLRRGETFTYVEIPILADTGDEGDEQVIVSASIESGFLVRLHRAAGVVTIVDDDLPQGPPEA